MLERWVGLARPSETSSPPPCSPPSRPANLNHFYPIDSTLAPGLRTNPSRYVPPRLTLDEQAELDRCDRILAERRWRTNRLSWRGT